MKVREVLMVIIGILSLIIFYKIYKGSLVEGAEGPPTLCDPDARPRQLCPGGLKCIDCGKDACPCPEPGPTTFNCSDGSCSLQTDPRQIGDYTSFKSCKKNCRASPSPGPTPVPTPTPVPSECKDLDFPIMTNENFSEMTRDDKYIDKIKCFDVSSVTDMNGSAFNLHFNEDISRWNVSNVTDMSSLFYRCTAFNQDLSSWDVHSVTNMQHMFAKTSAFNQDLSSWDVHSVTNMKYMFNSSTAFNQPLNGWGEHLYNVTDMSFMFARSSAFNQDLSSWNVSKVTDMNGMFSSCTAFNGDIKDWVVSLVTNMKLMFNNCSEFNQPLNGWGEHLYKVTDMSFMFQNCSAFNQDLSSWGKYLYNVTNMRGMFSGCPNTKIIKKAVKSWKDTGNIAKNNPINKFAYNEGQIFNYLGIGLM